ncbi:hypothetical protein NSQ54_11095 [Alkalihalobacillus sp. FSL W8-0930]
MYNRVSIIFIVLIIWFIIERFFVSLTGLAEPIFYLSIFLFFSVVSVAAFKEDKDKKERGKVLVLSAFLIILPLLAFILSIQNLTS